MSKKGMAMKHDWQALTHLTRGDEFVVERIRLVEKGISIDGEFELPALSRLTMEDQIFVIAFVRCHGSIKEMENLFGISYPTVKNRLNRIAQAVEFVEIDPPSSKADILAQVGRGEISVDEAEKILRRTHDSHADEN